eukprot:11709552-Alexandrium_andersonii.AAC.1
MPARAGWADFMCRNTCAVTYPLVNASSGPNIQPEGDVAPAHPTIRLSQLQESYTLPETNAIH